MPTLRFKGLKFEDTPRPSNSSSRGDERAVFDLHFSEEAGGSLERECMTKVLKKELAAFKPLIGWRETFGDKSAMFLEAPPAAAATTHSNLCLNMISINSKLVMVTTYHEAEEWAAQLTAAWHRPSQMRDSIYAQVAATST